MDILFHSVSGLVITKELSGEYFFSGALFATLPDILGAIPYQVEKYKHSDKDSISKFLKSWKKLTAKDKFFSKIDKIAYLGTHNLFAWTLFTAVAYLFFNNSLALSICYLSHLIIDSYTHSNEFALSPFYPLSNFRLRLVFSKSWGANKKLFSVNWLILIIMVIVQWL